MEMPDRLTYWTADEVAECLDISNALSGRLWQILGECQDKTPLGGDGSNGTVETPDGRLDDNDDKTPHWWGKLTEREQGEIVEALKNE